MELLRPSNLRNAREHALLSIVHVLNPCVLYMESSQGPNGYVDLKVWYQSVDSQRKLREIYHPVKYFMQKPTMLKVLYHTVTPAGAHTGKQAPYWN